MPLALSDPARDVTTLKFSDADGFYAELLQAHEGLDSETSALLDSQLVLLLANQVADPATLQACLRAARAALAPLASHPTP
ncbi:MAG TPA: DUF2783 domain-containing protein [Ideonella sp.]|nr:DUF2783 domain-containing protein [Ideonella sp.]